MRCSQFLANYSDYRDRQADEALLRDMEGHLQVCERCRLHDRAYQVGLNYLRADRIDLSEEAKTRFRVRMALLGRQGRQGRPNHLATAAALAGLAVAWGTFSGPRVAPVEPEPVARESGFMTTGLAATVVTAPATATVPPAPLEYQASYEPVSYRNIGADPDQ